MTPDELDAIIDQHRARFGTNHRCRMCKEWAPCTTSLLAAQLRDARVENERLRTQIESLARQMQVGRECHALELAQRVRADAAEAQLAAERAKVAKIRDWATADYGGVKTPAEVWPGLAALLGLDTAMGSGIGVDPADVFAETVVSDDQAELF